ncbi:histidine kinase dimerization/phosphoacceptor domain -containing protein [Sphingomonas sp. H160509]|uniref:histidine kinase dimerization/phosphoacceptor domain -containing protein n=1 Tax=Sphingomonas sp. H160509 TaxID=2955313 RepID=UPI002096B25A|nr:histidine kinase dimerization/phosphoacceptor domain -containing protein [Sphingomonas sp. H160509]MDD1453289.1 histidine kinase dimerization/phosphoacceptor domain -containing protein [Sphingomonas sp. H160509]
MVKAAQSACEAQDVLFEELHHRFLNSLQVIAAMASGVGREQAPASRRALLESLQDRISAMGEFHRRLALGSSGNLADDSRQIWRCLTTSFGRTDASLTFSVLGSELDMPTARVVA